MLGGLLVLLFWVPNPGVHPVNPPMPVRPDLSRCRVLLVGIDAYKPKSESPAHMRSPEKVVRYHKNRPNFENLKGAVRDMLDLERFLLRQVKKESGRVRLLTGTQATLAETRPRITAATVLQALKEIADEAEKDDWLFFVFSGHGALDDQGKPYLVMQHGEGIFPEDSLALHDLLEVFNARGKARHRTIILDACNSGRLHQQSSVSLNESFIQAPNLLPSRHNLVLLSAARGFQSSYENELGGYFIQGLLRGLRGLARLSKGAVSITLSDAYAYAALETMFRTGYRQTPYISGGLLDYELVHYKKSSSCETVFDIGENPLSHRTNTDLIIGVRLGDPSILPAWRYSWADPELILRWHLNRTTPSETRMTAEQGGVYQATIPSHALHTGQLTYWFEFRGGLTSGNFQISSRVCEWTIRIRQ